MIGFNFYPQSKRFINTPVQLKIEQFKRVGVFVQADLRTIEKDVKVHSLDFIQLHGDESPEFCQKASSIAPIIKVFRVDEKFDFNTCKNFTESSKYFLFDTFTKAYGGSGKKFDWTRLENYTLDTEFILSGGISNEDIRVLNSINHDKFIGVDLNSKYESYAGIKDIKKLKRFKDGILRNSKLP